MKNFRRISRLLQLFSLIFLTFLQPVHAEEKELKVNFDIIGGAWQRTDGNYRIKISEIQTDGQVKAEYFNPRPIHVAQSAVSTQKELIKLFIQLQDRGYEGSTYTLFYYAEKDALVGFYYQAAMDRTFEVIFFRKTN